MEYVKQKSDNVWNFQKKKKQLNTRFAHKYTS